MGEMTRVASPHDHFLLSSISLQVNMKLFLLLALFGMLAVVHCEETKTEEESEEKSEEGDSGDGEEGESGDGEEESGDAEEKDTKDGEAEKKEEETDKDGGAISTNLALLSLVPVVVRLF